MQGGKLKPEWREGIRRLIERDQGGSLPMGIQSPLGLAFVDGIWICIDADGNELWRFNPDEITDEEIDDLIRQRTNALRKGYGLPPMPMDWIGSHRTGRCARISTCSTK